ncbi:hypothetical protein PUNSTDRAFT_135846 [Punctularia strigosozonata HHB-11173 SS5]|uniref:uncharacterized protein n=1 Tax=Punctularia strigosozonata (strain HHB-11173) TaxID=741275 RepID=UPI000441805B|nr:uncharacterized protein PUNSTDRAFT_135846 [Punctularia strigosozonata HHB-11173 SS5]EIN07164.1 hypothetical protein PUNSTDRAFT_135846 [Punctularia strigosozonata HHB-11173 SS5]
MSQNPPLPQEWGGESAYETEDDDAEGADSDSDSETGEMADWDEEQTLVAMLQQPSPRRDDDADLAALSDRLKSPMSAQGDLLKEQILSSLVPAVRNSKTSRARLDKEVDVSFADGVSVFNDVCKEMELLAMQDEDSLKTAYRETQLKTKQLFMKLREAYTHRDRLWDKLHQDVDKCAARAESALNSIPGELEQTVTRLVAKCKDLEKDQGNSVQAKERTLKNLLKGL